MIDTKELNLSNKIFVVVKVATPVIQLIAFIQVELSVQTKQPAKPATSIQSTALARKTQNDTVSYMFGTVLAEVEMELDNSTK